MKCLENNFRYCDKTRIINYINTYAVIMQYYDITDNNTKIVLPMILHVTNAL